MLSTVIGSGVAGLLLLFLEMFLPGMIAGIMGAILLIISVVVAYTSLGTEAGNLTLLLATLSSGGLWWWWAERFQQTRLGKRMTLQTSVPPGASSPDLVHFVGQEGSTLTTLRPSGTVLLGGHRVDAITDGEFLEPGTPIRVIRVQGMTILVRQAV